ncbi:MAG: hypothetical protein ABIP06_13300 [Pyrinomonadaceae bacterium]
MRFIRLYLPIIAITLFISGCNSTQTDETGSTNPYPNAVSDGEIASGNNNYWAKDNLDLQRVGNLLEKADDAEEFEYLLNSEDGLNNLDLNGDGYVDYLSVSEYDNQDDNQRGFTLFDRFGPNEIQEIASVIFNRDRYNDPGARILLTGNDQIYGDNYNYETNWLDKSLAIAGWAFGNRDNTYESPYYYNNYPDYYENYRIVETPVYRTRIEDYYPEPAFIQTVNPTITDIRIKSKYDDRSIDNIYAKLAKPTKEQLKFKEKNPNYPEFVPVKKGNGKNDFEKRQKELTKDAGKDQKQLEKSEKKLDKQFEKREKQVDKEERKQEKRYNESSEKRNKPEKIEKQNVDFDRPKFEGKKGGNDKNRGGGNERGNGGGKDKGNGGGNGKGGGKGKQ